VSAKPEELTRSFGLDVLRAKVAGRPGSIVGGLAVVGALAVLGLVRWGGAEEPFAVAPIQVQETARVPRADPGPAAPEPAAAPPGADGASVKLAPAPDPRLVERTSFGMLPRIGMDGALPWKVYARPVGASERAGPRIAILIGGLGVGQGTTTDAIMKLPPAVTLAFAPYGTDLERSSARAREEGHEILLQVPMEPFDYPDNDPGPHTLTVRAGRQDNIDRLHWVMGRIAGYVGLVNFMGARLTADETALQPILKEIGSRGLLFLDDGSSSRSVLAEGGSTSAPIGRAQVVIDAVASADAIDRELGRLESLARDKGRAIGTAGALPVTIDRIVRWSKELSSRGVQLVPVSSLMEGQASR
jgi:polysaccharide deacetylase 2 family uncharacterized protein YibQ